MQIGASTANFYPQLTEAALDTVLAAGFKTVEIFLNTPCEATPAFARQLRERAADAGTVIVAAHPFSSFAEPHLLFSRYERRFSDTLETYRAEYEAAAVLGARFLVLHGDKAADPTLSAEEFAARYEKLYDLGQSFGVTLLQENVVNYRAMSPAFVREMRRLLKVKAQFVLDLKQCRRSGVNTGEMLDAMGDGLRHLHLSDGAPGHDCLIPGEGETDFAALFARLKAQGYAGDGVIELYRRNFDTADDLVRGRAALLRCL